MPFYPWPKISRLKREIIITEKLDGTNAGVLISTEEKPHTYVETCPISGHPEYQEVPPGVYASSRKRWITPENDNYGFARWVEENKETLVRDLGPGMHFGEWWGAGIQRKYNVGRKVWSLFNTTLWYGKSFETPYLRVVPVLYNGDWFTDVPGLALPSTIRWSLSRGSIYAPDYHAGMLKRDGSVASPGFMNPEGIVVFHVASNTPFKFTLDGDGHKG
jgi:hypothetical protein